MAALDRGRLLIPPAGRVRRRAALATVLAALSMAAGGAGLSQRLIARSPIETAPAPIPALPWRALLAHVEAGGPNERLGLVQGQHIFVRGGMRQVRSGLVRVRIPAALIPQGDEGWAQARFDDGWWMERLRDLGVPVKAVVELSPRYTDEQHAVHAARLVRRTGPGVVIVGNELNAVENRPRVDVAAEIERYLDRYAAIHAAVKEVAPQTRIQLYGEGYDGDPSDRNAFLRRVLAAFRRRALPPPDIVGIHIYGPAEALPARVAGYRRLLADFGLRLPVSVEELGPRQGVIDAWEARRLSDQPARDAERFPSRLAELQAHGWLTEDEQADLVAQHLATAAACADQAQVFCAIDFPAEIEWRRGLVSGDWQRVRPALDSFRFLQRLFNDVEQVERDEALGAAGVAAVSVVRRDGLAARVLWSVPLAGEERAPGRTIDVPPYTFVCDARGTLVLAPEPRPRAMELPAATSAECGGAVRIVL